MVAAALGSLALLPACNPYQNFSGEYYAGPIDGTNFLSPYQGTLPGPADQGGGKISPVSASVDDNPINYYLFPLGDMQGVDPAGMAPAAPLTIDVITPPKAYVFDPLTGPTPDALPSPNKKCQAPDGYVFDQRTEAYRHDEQGVIFTQLPATGSGYFPIVAETPVTSAGQACQDLKSAAAVKNGLDGVKAGSPDTKYLAFALIDPTADVQPDDPNSGLGPIHEGFYNHFLVLFIDGGYVPTVNVAAQGMTPAHTDMVTQKLFFPSSVAVTMTDPMTMMMTTVAQAGAYGQGYDLLEGVRGDSKYSPVCEVWTYDPDLDPMTMLPISHTAISELTAAEMATAKATGDLIYCFQVP
jgi:hypothetical protein